MKFIFISIKIIFLYFISFSSSYSIEAPDIKNLIIYEEKQKIKFFDFLNEAGNKVNLKDFKSELIILNFWATWCAPCKDEMPSLDKLQAKEGIFVYPINIEEKNLTKIDKFYTDLNIKNLNTYFDEGLKLVKIFSLRGVPTTIILNKNKNMIAKISGSVDFADKKFISWLDSIK